LSKQQTKKPSNPIETEYAAMIVKMLSTDDSSTILDCAYNLRQFDNRLKDAGIRTTIKVGTEKIG